MIIYSLISPGIYTSSMSTIHIACCIPPLMSCVPFQSQNKRGWVLNRYHCKSSAKKDNCGCGVRGGGRELHSEERLWTNAWWACMSIVAPPLLMRLHRQCQRHPGEEGEIVLRFRDGMYRYRCYLYHCQSWLWIYLGRISLPQDRFVFSCLLDSIDGISCSPHLVNNGL